MAVMLVIETDIDNLSLSYYKLHLLKKKILECLLNKFGIKEISEWLPDKNQNKIHKILSEMILYENIPKILPDYMNNFRGIFNFINHSDCDGNHSQEECKLIAIELISLNKFISNDTFKSVKNLFIKASNNNKKIYYIDT